MLSLLLLTPAIAMADQVTCESKDNKQVECNMNTSGEVRIVQQLSKTRCVEGENWGLFKHSVWVSGGCRAIFSSGGSGSANQSGYGGGNSNGGNDDMGPSVVTCESIDNRRIECDMNTRGRVRVSRQLSKTACIENQTWGLNKSSVWVSGGCRATFENESANSSSHSSRPVPQEPTPAHISACNARMPGEGDVESFEALTPGAWSIILNYRGRRFSCDVDGQGRVDGFEELN
jgi:hypothetical protein